MDQNMKEILQRVKVGAATAAEAVSRAADAATQKAGELADATKLNLQLFDRNTELEALFKDLGKIVYLTHTGAETDEAALEEKLAQIDEKYAQLSALKEEQEAAKATVICPVCGKSCDKNDLYCRVCGEKLR